MSYRGAINGIENAISELEEIGETLLAVELAGILDEVIEAMENKEAGE